MKQPEFDANKLIGMEIYPAFVWARRFGYTVRVVRKDKIDCAVQRNYNQTRINVAIENEVIVGIISLG